jgi:hypothetical protein
MVISRQITQEEADEMVLMSRIRKTYGAAIEEATAAGSLPPEFLAALIANESGGDPTAARHEPVVLTSLLGVTLGEKAKYGSIGPVDILAFLVPLNSQVSRDPVSIVKTALLRLDSLATSWGLTQIMGYEAIPFGIQISDLESPATCLRITVRMLEDFAKSWNLSLSKDFDSLLGCWNTGRPHAQTADLKYIPNGLARMQIYKSLPDEPPKAISA